MKAVELFGLLVFVLVIFEATYGLKCYTGFKIIGSGSYGTESKECEDDSDYCYNMTASAGFIFNAAKAGCSTYRCLLARDTCRSMTFQGVPVSLCCCSSDLCNAYDE